MVASRNKTGKSAPSPLRSPPRALACACSGNPFVVRRSSVGPCVSNRLFIYFRLFYRSCQKLRQPIRLVNQRHRRCGRRLALLRALVPATLLSSAGLLSGHVCRTVYLSIFVYFTGRARSCVSQVRGCAVSIGHGAVTLGLE